MKRKSRQLKRQSKQSQRTQTQILSRSRTAAPVPLETTVSPPKLYVKVPNVLGLGTPSTVATTRARNSKASGGSGAWILRIGRLPSAASETGSLTWRKWIRRWRKEKTTFRELLKRFDAINQGRAHNTQVTTAAVIKAFVKWLPGGVDMQVRHIRPSELDAWLALHEPRLRNTTYNRYAGFLKQLFDIALKDRVIAESPVDKVKIRWKNPQTVVRYIPTVEQVQAIVECVRSQPFTDHAHDSADFLEFLGLAGLGQAEASALTWGNVDWKQNRLNIHRAKTGKDFYVPLYAFLRPLMERLKREAGRASRSTKVFKIKDAKKALATACKTLGYHPFSQRNLRQSLIRRLWEAGVDKKLIARYQGHTDGGELILSTYTETFNDDDLEYERRQLNKLVA